MLVFAGTLFASLISAIVTALTTWANIKLASANAHEQRQHKQREYLVERMTALVNARATIQELDAEKSEARDARQKAYGLAFGVILTIPDATLRERVIELLQPGFSIINVGGRSAENMLVDDAIIRLGILIDETYKGNSTLKSK